jgi:hypothetical protein
VLEVEAKSRAPAPLALGDSDPVKVGDAVVAGAAAPSSSCAT